MIVLIIVTILLMYYLAILLSSIHEKILHYVFMRITILYMIYRILIIKL